MKKVAAILFSLFYLVITSGASFTMHYCGGQFASMEFMANKTSCCCNIEGIHEAEGCCYDETISFRFDEEIIVSQNSRNIPEKSVFEIKSFFSYNPRIDVHEQDHLSVFPESPPLILPEPVWLVNCSFLLYG
jgi:hypothetical protein